VRVFATEHLLAPAGAIMKHRSGLWIVILTAVVLGLFASYGIAWGALNDTDFPYGQDLNDVHNLTVAITRGTPYTVYSHTSSTSYYIYRAYVKCSAGTATFLCGVSNNVPLIQGNDTGWTYHDCNSSLKVLCTGTGAANVDYLLYYGDSFVEPSLGSISVDNSGIEDLLTKISEVLMSAYGFGLFFLVFFSVVFYFKR